jgi:lipoprotein-anchoring transpeptidase ErfK/SrfK
MFTGTACDLRCSRHSRLTGPRQAVRLPLPVLTAAAVVLLWAAAAQCAWAAPAAAAGPTELGVATGRATIPYHGSVILRGMLRQTGGPPVSGAEVRLLARAAGETAFMVVATARTGAQGTVVFRSRPFTTTAFRLEYAGDAANGLQPSASAEVVIAVRSRVTLLPHGALWAGERGSLTGKVIPARPAGTPVIVLVKQTAGWVALGEANLDATSSFQFEWVPPRPGRLRLRAFVGADDRNAAGRGRPHRILVHDPDPHAVPDSLPRAIVIDHSQFRVYFYESGRVVRDFPCVLGARATPTPFGHFRIQRKRPHPGGANGAYYMGYLGIIGIHGTNQPQLLRRFPRAYSHGCARLYNRDITWLYRRCPVGTPVWSVP